MNGPLLASATLILVGAAVHTVGSELTLLLLLLTRRDQVFKVPQWILLIGIGLLAWWGIV